MASECKNVYWNHLQKRDDLARRRECSHRFILHLARVQNVECKEHDNQCNISKAPHRHNGGEPQFVHLLEPDHWTLTETIHFEEGVIFNKFHFGMSSEIKPGNMKIEEKMKIQSCRLVQTLSLLSEGRNPSMTSGIRSPITTKYEVPTPKHLDIPWYGMVYRVSMYGVY